MQINKVSLNRLLLILLPFTTFFSGCVNSKYGLANFATESAYVPKPIYKDTTVSATYASADFHTSNDAYSVLSKNPLKSHFGNFGITRSTVSERFFHAYGGHAYLGYMETVEVKDEDHAIIVEENFKDYLGGGLFGSFGRHFSGRRMDIILGTKVSVLYEKGQYSAFRSRHDEYAMSSNQGFIFPDVLAPEVPSDSNLTPHDFSANISATLELAYKLKQGNVGVYGSIGTGHQKITMGSTLFLTIKRATLQTSVNFSLHGGCYWGTGLAYRLPSLSKK